MNASSHFQSQGDWIDAARFEQLYPFKRRTFFNWIKEGRVTAYKPSVRKTLIKRSDVDRLLEASQFRSDLDKLVDETVRELGAGK